MLFITLLLSLATPANVAPASMIGACASMWTNQPFEGYLGVMDADGQFRSWSAAPPASGVTVWVCASRPAYAWLWAVLPDGTPRIIWPQGSNLVELSPRVPAALPQASFIAAADARSLLLAITPTAERPQPIKEFNWMAPDVENLVRLNRPDWPDSILWEPIRLQAPTAQEDLK